MAQELRVNGTITSTWVWDLGRHFLFLSIKDIYSAFISVPPVILPLSFGQSVLNEGGFAQVSCIVTEGDEPLTIGWTFHGHTLSAALGIVTTPLGSRGSSLMIPSVGHKHRGNYTCKASNLAAVRTQSVELRVNGE